MKRIVTFLSLSGLLFWSVSLLGQADTVVVPATLNGSPLGAINHFILGDTTPTGERKNPDRVYKLLHDKIYFMDGEFRANFDLKLIADPWDENSKPPIVASTTGANGKVMDIQFILLGDAIIKNIIFQLTPPEETIGSTAAFWLSKEGGNYEFDRIMVEWSVWVGITTVVPINKVTIKNCIFRNQQHPTNIWNGRGMNFYQRNPADTVLMYNNTFFNMNSFAFAADISSFPPKYFLFDHNTLVNTMKFPIHSFWLPNAVVSNNIFYNTHSYGENKKDREGQDPDELQYGIINISKMSKKTVKYLGGLTESERRYIVKNNDVFYSDAIKNYWKANKLPANVFMNSRTKGMFEDKATYPFLQKEFPLDKDPGFVNAGNAIPDMVRWMNKRRRNQSNTLWGWDPDGSRFQVGWPLPEDLSYTNEEVKKAAEGGFPLGDLNWWDPSVKEEWEKWKINAVQSVAKGSSTIKLHPNRPNPFVEETLISYELPTSGAVQIDLLDLEGHLVTPILKSKQEAGAHRIIWRKGNQKPGVYLYRIKMGGKQASAKLIIAK